MIGRTKLSPLRARFATRIDALDRHDWDSVVTKPLMRYDAIRALEDVAIDHDSLYALVSDRSGPYAAISATPNAEVPLLLTVAPRSGRSGGIQLRKDVTLDAAVPRLVPTLARMARRRRAVGFEVLAHDEAACATFRSNGFAELPLPPSTRTDLTPFASYDAFLASLPSAGRKDLRRMRRRSEEYGIRFEVTSPPRASASQLFALLGETFRAHGVSMPFAPTFFERLWAAPFAQHVLFTASFEGELVLGVAGFRDGTEMSVPFCAINYERSRPSFAYFSIYDEILKYAFANGIRVVDWGMSNDDIKIRYGAHAVPAFSFVKPALPLPSAVTKGVVSLLRKPSVARLLGIA